MTPIVTEQDRGSESLIFSGAMMRAWGYRADEQTAALIDQGRELVQRGEISTIADAKTWARSQRAGESGENLLEVFRLPALDK